MIEGESSLRKHICRGLDENRRLPMEQRGDKAFALEIPMDGGDMLYAVMAVGAPGRRYEWITKTVLNRAMYNRTLERKELQERPDAPRVPGRLGKLGDHIDLKALRDELAEVVEEELELAEPEEEEMPTEPLLPPEHFLLRHKNGDGRYRTSSVAEDELATTIMGLLTGGIPLPEIEVYKKIPVELAISVSKTP